MPTCFGEVCDEAQAWSRRFWAPTAACLATCIDNSMPGTFTRLDLTVSSREERKGNAVQDRDPNSAAAPATVSGELVPQSHWEIPGRR
jgi:hypothetical protein